MTPTVPLKPPVGNADTDLMRGDRRFGFSALVGFFVAVVLTGGVVSAASVNGEPPSDERRARTAGESVAGLAPEASTTTASTTVAAPPRTVTTAPTGPTTVRLRPPATTSTTRPAPGTPTTKAPSTTSTVVLRSTRANFGPLDPTAVEIPFSAGRTTWTGVSNGVSITVRTDKPAPKSGEQIQFDIEMSGAGHDCCGLWFLFGDGSVDAQKNGWSCPDGGPAGPGPVHFRSTHTYNLDGRWTFGVYPIIGSCRDPGPHASPSLFGSIEVMPGTTTAQGPARPRVIVDTTTRPAGHETDYSWASVAGEVTEEDGWIRSVELDWGDGSPRQSFGGTSADMACPPTPSGWPRPNRKTIFTNEAIHHYSRPGPYTITLVAVSTACDGASEAQTGTDTVGWHVPSG